MLSVSTPINNDTHRSHQLTVVSKDSKPSILVVSIKENTQLWLVTFLWFSTIKTIIKPPVFLGIYPWFSPPKPPAVTGQRAPSVCLSFRPPGHAAVAGLGRLRLRRGSGGSAAYSSRAQWPRETQYEEKEAWVVHTYMKGYNYYYLLFIISSSIIIIVIYILYTMLYYITLHYIIFYYVILYYIM